MLKKKSAAFVVALLLLCFVFSMLPAARGAEENQKRVYVDPVMGSDSGSGDIDNPFKTMEKAFSYFNGQNENMIIEISGHIEERLPENRRWSLHNEKEVTIKTNGFHVTIYFKGVECLLILSTNLLLDTSEGGSFNIVADYIGAERGATVRLQKAVVEFTKIESNVPNTVMMGENSVLRVDKIVHSGEAAAAVVYEQSELHVSGDIISEGEYAVICSERSIVKIGGHVNATEGRFGVDAASDAYVEVAGNISVESQNGNYCDAAQAHEGGRIVVQGNIWAKNAIGVRIFDSGQVVVFGEINEAIGYILFSKMEPTGEAGSFGSVDLEYVEKIHSNREQASMQGFAPTQSVT